MLFSSTPASRMDARAQLLAEHHASIARGEMTPFLYPWATVAAGLVVLFLLFPYGHWPFLRNIRYVVWFINTTFSAYGILCTRIQTTIGYCGGLISAWAILWGTTLLITHDPQRDFRRVWPVGSSANSRATSTNGSAIDVNSDKGTRDRQSQPAKRYRWQSYPSTLIDRLVWVTDLFTQFRGIGWNWQLPALPPLPRKIREQLGDDTTYESNVGRDGTRRYDTRSAVLTAAAKNFIIGYLALDVLTVFAIHDPYFWGLTDYPAPRWLPQIFHESTFLLRSYRNVVTMFAVYAALQTVFALAPLFFVGALGSAWIGTWGEPWMYPEVWGSFSKVLDYGLTGFWGSWWHQAFRYGFESNAKAAVAALGISEKTTTGMFLKLLFVFALSGFLHASGSFSSFGDSKPISGSFLFFVLQPFAVTVQLLVTKALRRLGLADKTPRLVKQLVMFVWTYSWLHITAPLICDDFAKTGIWMIEPCPVSPLRGIGFGEKGDTWLTWKGDWVSWHQGEHWWQTGIAL